VPGIRSSRTYVLDTSPNARQPQVAHTIEPEELAATAGRRLVAPNDDTAITPERATPSMIETAEPRRPAGTPFRPPPQLLEPVRGQADTAGPTLGDEHQMVLE
jgi:hypothetical protein